MYRSISADRNSFRIDSSNKNLKFSQFAKEQRRIPLESFAKKSFHDMISNKDKSNPQGIPYCYQCSKDEAFYYAPSQDKYYCGTCGMDQMPYGTQLEAINHKHKKKYYKHQKHQKYIPKIKEQRQLPFSDYRKVHEKNYKYNDFHGIFDKLGDYEVELKTWLRQRKSHNKDMHQLFKSAKSFVKQHYQKLFQLIKQCQKADQEALNLLQKQQAQMFGFNKKTIEGQIETLEKFNRGVEHKMNSLMQNIQQLKQTDFMEHLRRNIIDVGNWIKEDLSKKLHQVFLNKRSTKMYKSQRYRVINQQIHLSPIVLDVKTKKALLYAFQSV